MSGIWQFQKLLTCIGDGIEYRTALGYWDAIILVPMNDEHGHPNLRCCIFRAHLCWRHTENIADSGPNLTGKSWQPGNPSVFKSGRNHVVQVGADVPKLEGGPFCSQTVFYERVKRLF